MNRGTARLSEGAYKGTDVEGYQIDHRLSNEYGTVYVSNKTGKATVAFSGTQFNAPHKGVGGKIKRAAKDVWADLHIASGTEQDSEEFRKASAQFEEVQKQYGKGNVDVTGHSLGGSKAMYISSKYGVHADAYNPGWTPEGALLHSKAAGKVRQAVTGKKGYVADFHKVDVYRTPLDFASPATLLPGQGLHAHTVSTHKEASDILKGGLIKLHGVTQFINSREKPADSKPSTNQMLLPQTQKQMPLPPTAGSLPGTSRPAYQPNYRAHVLRNG
jgi:hypothetical protein